MVEICPADWPESKEQVYPGNRSPSYTKWFSSSIDLVAWPVQWEDSPEEFQKKRFDEAVVIANRNMGAKSRSNTVPSIFPADLFKGHRKFV